MTADEIKAALRQRHPAVSRRNGWVGPGAWTTIEEWLRIDLLAVSAWSSIPGFPPYARIGYEVKVSRGDYRRELAKPGKRRSAVAFCHEFYFAAPLGLLRSDEVAWTEPPGFAEIDPFAPIPCLGFGGWTCDDGRLVWPRYRYRADRYGAAGNADRARRRALNRPTCPVCLGSGRIGEGAAVRAGAPGLWIPADVGLVAVDGSGRAIVVKRAPRRQPDVTQGSRFWGHDQAAKLSDGMLADLLRWTSIRPDPRHEEIRRAG